MSEAGGFLGRWSRLKRGEAATSETASATVPKAPPASAPRPAELPVAPSGMAEAGGSGAGGAPPVAADAALPPVESLDLAADFTAFMREEVSEGLRRAALKKLFSDPHFNRMDGLDIYIDDYSIPDPIPDEVLKRMTQFETLLAEPEVPSPPSEACATTAPVAAPTAPDAEDAAEDAAEDPPEVEDNLSCDGQIVDGDAEVRADARAIKDSSGD